MGWLCLSACTFCVCMRNINNIVCLKWQLSTSHMDAIKNRRTISNFYLRQNNQATKVGYSVENSVWRTQIGKTYYHKNKVIRRRIMLPPLSHENASVLCDFISIASVLIRREYILYDKQVSFDKTIKKKELIFNRQYIRFVWKKNVTATIWMWFFDYILCCTILEEATDANFCLIIHLANWKLCGLSARWV